LLSMTRKYLSQTEISTSKNIFTDAKEVVDGVGKDSCLSTQQKRFSILIIKDTNMARLVPRQTKQPSPQVNLITRGTGLWHGLLGRFGRWKARFVQVWHSWWGPRVSVVLRNRCRCFRSSVHWWRPSLPSGKLRLSVIEVALVTLIRTSTPMLAVKQC
jgi:hypothetical protein